jgi:ribosomal protein S18 acetylase RimI-like enzyme
MSPVTLQDIDELAALDAQLFPENSFNETTLAIEIALGIGWTIRKEGKIAAYALARHDGHVLDVIRLGVHPNYQRQGFGSNLLIQIFSRRCDTILTVRTDNEKAMRLYLSYGFSFVGRFARGEAWVLLRRGDHFSGRVT